MLAEQVLELEVVEFAERWVGRWNAHDVEGILALVTEDITWEDPSIDDIASGPAAARRYIEHLFRAFPDISWTMPSGLFISLEDDEEIVKVGQPWACSGTALGPIDPPGFAPTGMKFALEGFDVWALQRSDSKVRQVVSHYDALEFARRVGLVPARGSVGERVLVGMQRLRARLGR